jgi:hypothetical protein
MIHLSECTELNMIEAKKYAAPMYSSPYMRFALVVVKSAAPDSNARHLTDPVIKTVDNYLVCIGMTKEPATYSPYYEPPDTLYLSLELLRTFLLCSFKCRYALT